MIDNTGKEVIIQRLAQEGICLTYADIVEEIDGGYSIDGMPWDEWRDAMVMP